MNTEALLADLDNVIARAQTLEQKLAEISAERDHLANELAALRAELAEADAVLEEAGLA